jgi:hypothetical protein
MRWTGQSVAHHTTFIFCGGACVVCRCGRCGMNYDVGVQTTSVSVCRPSDRTKRQVVNHTRDEECPGETQDGLGKWKDGLFVLDEEFWAGFVDGLPIELALPFLPFAGKLVETMEVPNEDRTNSSASPATASGVAPASGAVPVPTSTSTGTEKVSSN